MKEKKQENISSISCDKKSKDKENIEAFRKAYYDILYHYDTSKEKKEMRALIVRKENFFTRISNKVKQFFYFYPF